MAAVNVDLSHMADIVRVDLPPHCLEAEEAVLGSLFIDPDVMPVLAGILSPEDFYREKNQWCFAAALKLYRAGRPTDQILVAHELAKQRLLEACGGGAYISHCVYQVPTSVHAQWYAAVVRELSARRQALQYGKTGEKPRSPVNWDNDDPLKHPLI